jgi:regulation of enolase protein 1 (concanavalin A-like superfamily)
MPGWFRLQRAGNVFTASQSADGVTWFTVGSSTIVMPTTYYVGFAACSGDTTNNTAETSRFDNVTPISLNRPSCQLFDVKEARRWAMPGSNGPSQPHRPG